MERSERVIMIDVQLDKERTQPVKATKGKESREGWRAARVEEEACGGAPFTKPF